MLWKKIRLQFCAISYGQSSRTIIIIKTKTKTKQSNRIVIERVVFHFDSGSNTHFDVLSNRHVQMTLCALVFITQLRCFFFLCSN